MLKKSPSLIESGLELVKQSISQGKSLQGYDFPIYDAGQGYLTVEFKTEQEKTNYLEQINQLIRSGIGQSYSTQDGEAKADFQLPKIVAIFQYGEKRYITLSEEKETNGQTNDCLYKGLVVDPFKFPSIQGDLFDLLNNS